MGIFNKTFGNDSSNQNSGSGSRPQSETMKTEPPKPITSMKINSDIIRKANAGDPAAQCKIGLKYNLDGYIVSQLETMNAADPTAMKDFKAAYGINTTAEEAYAEAFKWLSSSANQKYGPAEHYLALMYRDGTGVEKSDEMYRTLLQSSRSHSVINFAPTDPTKKLRQYTAKEIYSLLAEVDKGNPKAMYELAWAFLQKNPVKDEEIPGISHYNGKLIHDSAYASYDIITECNEDIAVMRNGGFDEELGMSRVFIENALELLYDAKKSIPEAKEEYDALSELSEYDSVYGCRKPEMLTVWLSKNVNRLSPIVECLLTGGLEPSVGIGVLQHAAQRGYSSAYVIIAMRFKEGKYDDLLEEPEYPYMSRDRGYKDGIRKTKYIEYMKKAVNQNNTEAMVQLGGYYIDYFNEEKDEKAGFGLLMEAAKKGNARAMFLIAQCYQEGIGTAKSDEKAIEWYNKAAKAGNEQAATELSFRYGIQFKTDRQKDDEEFDNRFWR